MEKKFFHRAGPNIVPYNLKGAPYSYQEFAGQLAFVIYQVPVLPNFISVIFLDGSILIS